MNFSFFVLNYTIKLSISLFLDVNQLKIAKMDNFSHLQVIERIPELRYKYMGSYTSDKVPRLKNTLLQLLTQLQAMIEGNTGS